MPLKGQSFNLSKNKMTVISTANPSVETASIVAEFGGQATQSVDLMIGVGLVKDSEAVYFQYVGDDQKVALLESSGKPVSRIGNVRLTGLSIVDDVYAEAGFSGSKLNVFLTTQSDRTVMLTSGLVTIWSQCLMTSLMGLFEGESLNSFIAIDTWKGTSAMKPCFAAVRNGGIKATSNDMYQALTEARSDKDKAKTDALMRDAVTLINTALSETSPQNVIETVVTEVVKDF
tara:strand:- start:849 stop:1541 length:693 start_codon:yes stop_codon:yes gene_type:complete